MIHLENCIVIKEEINLNDQQNNTKKKISDYTKDELESYVAKEEKEIIKSYKNKSIAALLALLGINIF